MKVNALVKVWATRTMKTVMGTANTVNQTIPGGRRHKNPRVPTLRKQLLRCTLHEEVNVRKLLM